MRAGSTLDRTNLVAEFERCRRQVLHGCELEPVDRVVRTRHDDAMLLNDYLVTRIVELGVHGLDLAAALGRRPWLTQPARQIIVGLLLGNQGDEMLQRMRWDELDFLRKATGREPMTAAEIAGVEQSTFRWLTLR